MGEQYRDDDDDALRPMIHRAAGRGDVETAEKLLDEDPSLVHVLNELGNQPLHEACWEKHEPMVRLLIEHGADVNARGDFGQVPLHFAVRDGGEEATTIVRMLLESGADIEAKDDRLRQNALGFALREFDDDLAPAIDLLRDRGSSLCLESAVIVGDHGRLNQFLSDEDKRPDIEEVRTALQVAESTRQEEIAQSLQHWLDHGSTGTSGGQP